MRSAATTLILSLVFLVTACNHSLGQSSMLVEKKYKEGYVESDKVKLHFLDWGGRGEVLVLIPGLGDTPFLMDGLATQLSTQFHVIGYSRRDHGKSISKETRYDIKSLVSDLKLLLDALSIGKASLLGWSFGGNEITAFASLYPERMNKLIYLESGYDLSDGGFENLLHHIPKSYLADSLVMTSLNNYRSWYYHFWFGDVEWNEAFEANLLASVKTSPDGSIETIPNDKVFKATLGEGMNYRRTYEKVHSPSLVIYAKPFFHPPDYGSLTVTQYDSIEKNIVGPWRAKNRKRIEKEIKNATIVEAPRGSHTSSLFLSNDFLVDIISKFLVSE
jgi:pimeloyl-ACP methyl ester carboxylesterase